MLENTVDLTIKNFKVILRSPKYLMFLILSPILIMLAVQTYEQALNQAMDSYSIKDFPIEKINHISRCTKPSDCTTLSYFLISKDESVQEPAHIKNIMGSLAKNSGLKMGEDIKLIGAGHPNKFRQYIQQNQNSTQAVVLWCLDSWNINVKNPYKKVGSKFTEHDEGMNSGSVNATSGDSLMSGGDLEEFNFDIPCQFDRLNHVQDGTQKELLVYTLAYNETIGFQNPYFTDQTNPYPANMLVVNIKRALDQAIINFYKPDKEHQFDLKMERQPYPKFALRFNRNKSFVSNVGSFFFFFPIAVSIQLVQIWSQNRF